MKILVTGGAGFIGSKLVDNLLKSGHKVCVYDALLNFIDKPHYFRTSLEHRKLLYKQKPDLIIEEDIQDKKALQFAFDKFRPEIVVHLAGLPMARPLANYTDAMIPHNMDGTLRVLDAFEKSPSARRLIYTSSSMAYGHFTQSPQTEEVTLNPTNMYGATKAAGEYFVKLSKKEWVIVRPTSVYGYTDAANRVTQLLFDAAITKKSAWIVRGETLDFSYVDDVADGFQKCIESHSAMYQTFNISRGEPRSAQDFAETLKQYLPNFTYELREPSSQQVYRGALDISKAKKLLGYDPKFNIENGIKEMIRLAKKYKWKKTAYKD
jgi:nucleoside-diphosphate-sugar epimerase